MKQKYFIIRAKVEGRLMYFSGNAIKNGNPLFSSNKNHAKVFTNEQNAEDARLCLVEAESAVEEFQLN